MNLNGKVAVITGGAQGIGEASANLYAKLGATVVIVDIQASEGARVARTLGTPHRFIHADVADRNVWNGIVAQTVSALGSLDLLVLNAGVVCRPEGAPALDDPIKWLTHEAYLRMTGVNIGGVYFGILAAIPYMEVQGGGAIVAMSSSAALAPFAPDPIYTMTKSAVVGLVRSLGPVLGARGITLNAVCPVNVDTPMVPEDLKIRGAAGEPVLNKLSGLPLQSPEKISEAVLAAVEAGGSGEVWISMANAPASRWEFEEVPWRVPSDTSMLATLRQGESS